MQRCQLLVLPVPGRRIRLPRQRLEAVVEAALAEADVGRCSLHVQLVDAARSAQLHADHFSDPTATDVMTFPDGSVVPGPGGGRRHLGDLAVCIDVAQEQAGVRGRPAGEEVALYILHGLLHLLGYDDVTPAKRRRMWAAQRRLLAEVGIDIEAQPC